MIFFIICVFIKCDNSLLEKIKFLNLPFSILNTEGNIKNNSEITIDEINKAYEAFKYPLNQDSFVIVSSRFESIEDQFHHFIFGTAIGYALNRSIKLEMRRYSESGEQPKWHLKFKNITGNDFNIGLYDTNNFMRLRVARELFCKNESYFQTDDPSIPILIRNFDDITTLYGNHFIGQRLRKLFGIHAVYFLAHHFLDKLPLNYVSKESENHQKVIGVEAYIFSNVYRMKALKDEQMIESHFINALERIDPLKESKIVLFTNSKKLSKLLENSLADYKKDLIVLTDEERGFESLISVDFFIGTYRSKFSQAVNSIRGEAGILVNTNTGDIIPMSNSQTGTLQPFIQDIEDIPYTINEKLRGCEDNINELREILDVFVL